ncbi:MAG: twin-arginine translocation signal domain-containing protein [Candidatus Eremiobacteraeota bacterium]|uniref:Uncharacterized protein n=1 Tax=mine drainage metagenome TaxID=410659 RepID=E6PFQ8_9ZZZZ|nr:twin-arginine translocation signal domain-containing protein [Candidatus Eremiobacteraeota bacterium]
MKSSRRVFLAGAALGVGAALLASAPVIEASPTAKPTVSPTPTPAPTPSPGALDLARAMRRFDPQLTDAQLEKIAEGIEQGYAFGASLNPHGSFLQNGDAPVPQFEVRP